MSEQWIPGDQCKHVLNFFHLKVLSRRRGNLGGGERERSRRVRERVRGAHKLDKQTKYRQNKCKTGPDKRQTKRQDRKDEKR